jgi:hypothetical protein
MPFFNPEDKQVLQIILTLLYIQLLMLRIAINYPQNLLRPKIGDYSLLSSFS